MKRRGSSSRWSRNGQGGYGSKVSLAANKEEFQESITTSAQKEELAVSIRGNEMDERFGFPLLKGNCERTGWLINMKSTVLKEEETNKLLSAMDFYFLQSDGICFKVMYPYQPYFYVSCKEDTEREVEAYLQKKYPIIVKIDIIAKEDLDLPNHLSGLLRNYLKLHFNTQTELMRVRSKILSEVKKANASANGSVASVKNFFLFQQHSGASTMTRRADTGGLSSISNATTSVDGNGTSSGSSLLGTKTAEISEYLLDIREYDIPYHIRVAIDLDICIGLWYDVRQVTGNGLAQILPRADLVERPEPIVFAFDIETTKQPLRFPDSKFDAIMMISYMLDKQGYLIINREFVSEDIEDFEYTPKPDFEGPFIVFNEKDEKSLLVRFFSHIQESKPHIFVTYNGDFFDWPFIETRAAEHNLDMREEIGFSADIQGEYKSRHASHMDCFRWVKRDSYLPVGSQGLKAVTKAKLGYNPVEVPPEDMCRLAMEQPQEMATYSVSDAVATYYLYMKYVHPFVFSLCTIIPMEPDEVLRKGSGTLCETLLMVESANANIIMPNKQQASVVKFHGNHLLESETYVGGHVEAVESGVFRSDFKYHFRIVPSYLQQLIDNLDRTLVYALETEGGIPKGKVLENVTNYSEIRDRIIEQLEVLRDEPYRHEKPLIYHLDVSAMYPNIILTNRLQPVAIVDEATCAACDFNRPDATCRRELPWTWRGDMLPLTRNEYEHIKQQMETEIFPNSDSDNNKSTALVKFAELEPSLAASMLKQRLAAYARKVYKKNKVTKEEYRTTTNCQRENSFYVDTVRNFRDRRYVYKGHHKTWKRKLDEALEAGDLAAITQCKNMIILYDSLQLAHKCILNSFYGYVMRRGARWYSMEMAGMVCHAGASIIKQARELVEQIGRPLELDTDGIWCALPCSFPENFVFTTNSTDKKKSKIMVSYPGAMLNIGVFETFSNPHYQTLVDAEKLDYKSHTECSIFFEVDGPYLAMILPASKEEDKRLKKRYCVFNEDGSLAELKGFEVKRRGELQLIKIFQTKVFEAFKLGSDLTECYKAVGNVADHWLDVLYGRGCDLEDDELFNLISEDRNMSRALADYGEQKSTSISTAKRLAQFLGDKMVEGAGLSCKFIISREPVGAPVTERAIPVAIFQAEESVKRKHLRDWLKQPQLDDFGIRSMLDWEYYIERFASTVQKIVTIPAAMQKISNPVPRIRHPDWLLRRVRASTDKHQQKKIDLMLRPISEEEAALQLERQFNVIGSVSNAENVDIRDMEDTFSSGPSHRNGKALARVTKKGRKLGSFRCSSDNLKLDAADDGTADGMAASLAAALADLGNMPNRTNNYQSWLAWMKSKWNIQRHWRKRRRIAGVALRQPESGSGAMTAYVRQQQELIAKQPWHILQIAETEVPGEFRLWALIGDQMHGFSLTVPRVFYVNCRTDDASGKWKQVKRQLPRGHVCLNLYEFIMPDRKFLKMSKELSTFFTHQDVEGVYESTMPLIFRAVLTLGSVCKLRNGSGLAGCTHFELDDLVRIDQDADLVLTKTGRDVSKGIHAVSTKSSPPPLYLQSSSVKELYLFHSRCDERGIFAIAVPNNNADNDDNKLCLHIIVINPFGHLQVANVKRAYREKRLRVIKARREDEDMDVESSNDGSPEPPEDVTFKVTVERSTAAALLYLQRLLRDTHNDMRGMPTLMIMQSPEPACELASAGLKLIQDVPIVQVASYSGDSEYPTLDWQMFAVKRMLNQFAQVGWFMQDLLRSARYGGLPLGNMPTDHLSYMLDVLYARRLRASGAVLWASPSDRPDLGGREEDDNRLVSGFDDDMHYVLSIPGHYSTMCVELGLENMSVMATVFSTAINDTVGGADSGFSSVTPQAVSLDDNVRNDMTQYVVSVFDDALLSAGAFRILKSAVTSWLHHVSMSKDIVGDSLLNRFYRWLKSSESLLHDGALFRHVQGLMRKLFMMLVTELQRLGSEIIYASFDRIIVCTKKKTLRDAREYINYILTSISARQYFYYLNVQPKVFWADLLWMDAANYGGIYAPSDESVEMSMDGTESENNQDNIADGTPRRLQRAERSMANVQRIREELVVESHWNMAEYLPSDVATCFAVIVTEFISKLYMYRIEASMTQTPGATPARNRRHAVDPTTDDTTKYSRTLVSSYFSQKLFKLIPTIMQRRGEFPRRTGSHLKMEKPALEFVKCISEVFALDESVRSQVTMLKKSLLRLIGTREFAPEAVFRDPCMTFTLTEVVCSYCNHCRDVDLCREEAEVEIGNNGPGNWTCKNCKTEYETFMMEHRLVEILQRRNMAYQLQDLICVNCNEVKTDSLTDFCRCSSQLSTRTSRDDFLLLTRTFYNIASFHNLPFLKDLTEWILSSNEVHFSPVNISS